MVTSITKRLGARHIVAISGGRRARLQLAALYSAAQITRPLAFRGLQRIARAIARSPVSSPDTSVVLQLRGGAKLQIYLNDAYWTPLLMSTYEYEPEIATLLDAISSMPICFIDCGANIGYWSVVARQALRNSTFILAIEPSASRYLRLLDNSQLSCSPYECLQAAVWHAGGETMDLFSKDDRSGGATLVDGQSKLPGPGLRVEPVPTVALDDLLSRYPALEESSHVLIKLDIEGAEIPALVGASQLLSKKHPLLIYEEHGADPQCRVSKYIFGDLRYSVFYWQPQRWRKPILLMTSRP